MHILVISQYFWPENFRINDLVSGLLDRGHSVTVLTGYPNYPAGKIFEEFKNNPAYFQKFGNANIVRVPMFPRGNGSLRLVLNYLSFALSASFWGAWRLRKSSFDTIFVFEPSPITVGLPAILIRYLKKAPVIFWVLDLWPETLKAIGVVKSNTILNTIGKLVSLIYRHCDLILAQSKSFIPQIRQYCEPDQYVEYFPSWSDASFDLAKTVPAIEIPLADDCFSVLFAGNIGDAQDFPAILEAIEHTRNENIRWLIVGDGRIASWVANEIKHRGIANKVLMLGQYPVERMSSFFKHADALLVSLKNTEIFAMTIPGKLQSYLAAGIPILAMLNGEGAEIVKEGDAGLVCAAGDSKSLAKNVIELSRMSLEKRKLMGANGKIFYEGNFHREKLINRLENFLYKLLASHNQGNNQ